MKIILFLLMSVAINVNIIGQENTSGSLDSLFQSLNQYGQINGNVLIAEKGKLVYKHSFGYADFADKKLNGDSSRFSIGSVSKIFTAVAILQLKEKRKFRLDDPLVKYLPGFRYSEITIRHLLTHTSGLPDYELYDSLMEQHPEKIFSNADIFTSLNSWKKPLYFKPGEKWQYSNTNFCLLALLVEKVSKMRFQDYLEKQIFLPAKMLSTYFLTDTMKVSDKYRVNDYQYSTLYDTVPRDVTGISKVRWRLYNLSGFTGQGNIITSTNDLLNFDQSLYDNKLIKAATLQEAFKPARLNTGEKAVTGFGFGKASYGLGWFILEDSSVGKVVWHGGGVPGAVSIFLRNITKKQLVIVLDNAFSNGIYYSGVNAMNILNHKSIPVVRQSLTQKYGSYLVKKGPDLAYCKLFQLRADSIHYYLDENQMNALGYQLMYEAGFDGHDQLSLEVLKINTLLFPSSYNVYDSYGEGLMKNGHKEEAIMMYKKALELNPENTESKEALKRILEKG